MLTCALLAFLPYCSSPEAEGVSSRQVAEWITASERELDALHGFVLLRHGKVIAEGSWAPYDTLNETHRLYSHSKSFTSTAVGFLVDDGKLDLDERVVDILSDKAPADPSDNLKALRVRDLLTMNVGAARADAERDDADGDWERAFLANTIDNRPGQAFRYDSGATYLLAAIVERRSGEKLMDFLVRRLFRPLGIAKAWSTTSPSGTACGGWGMNMTTRELALFGQLYLNRGLWNGNRILSEEWIALATSRQTWSGPIGVTGEDGSDWHQGYGFQFWRCRHGFYRADGANGQLTVVMPQYDAVLSVHAGLGDMQKELDLVWNRLLPALEAGPLPEDPVAAQDLKRTCGGLALPSVGGAREGKGVCLGAGYRLEKPVCGLQTVRIDASGEEWTATFGTESGEWAVPVGFGVWRRGALGLCAGRHEPLGRIVGEQRVASSAAYGPDGTFKVRVLMLDGPQKIDLSFSGAETNRVVSGVLHGLGGGAFEGTRGTAGVLQGRVPSRLAGNAARSEITFTKPVMRWLWGGFGFHNSEATMLRVMTDEFRDERVYKTFREVSPTYARVFAGFAEWPKEMMDSFADYYDATFRRAGTTIYMVPGRFPYVDRDFDATNYFDSVARNLEYLVKERNLTKLRYYAIANELSAGNVCCWFDRAGKMDLYRDYCEEAYCAFKRHGLDIGLQTTDRSSSTTGCEGLYTNLVWATKNVDAFTDTYCWHTYDYVHEPGDRSLYDWLYTNSLRLVGLAGRMEKRLSLGEYGFEGRSSVERKGYGSGVMRDDGNYAFRNPDKENLAAISQVEMALAAFNAGTVSVVKWTMFDYPDPFLRENGDTPEEKARYDVVRYSGHGLQIRYNKCGIVRWDDENRDYSARAELYTLGYLAKFFRKGGRVLPWTTDDAKLIAGGITNPDGSATFAIINWGEAKEVRVKSEHRLDRPLRIYEYDSAKPPYNAFNDLQPPKGTVTATDGAFTVTMPAKSLVFLTTDYVDRTPSEVEDVDADDGRLAWDACEDPEHVYYRVYKNGRQIRSTVATSCAIDDEDAAYEVKSVDKWGNVR